jgi:hypothetical protein
MLRPLSIAIIALVIAPFFDFECVALAKLSGTVQFK